MQPNRASRRAIIEIDINEVAQGSDTPRTSSRQSSARTSQQRQGSLDQRAGRHGTSSGEQGSLDSGSLNPHASQQGSLNPPVAGTGSLDPGSLDQRAARHRTRATEHGSLNSGSLDPHASQHGSLNPLSAETGSLEPGSLDQRAARPEARSVEQESLDSGSLNPHASQQGSLDPPVAATGSLDPGSLNQRVASPRTSGSSVSILPPAPEAVGVAEYIVLAEAIAQVGIDPTRPADQHIPVALATEAPPLSFAARVPPIATAVAATSSDSIRLPTQWGVGIPLRSSTSRSSSSRPPVPDPAAQAGGPPNLDEYVNGPLFNAGGSTDEVDVEVARDPKRRKLLHQASRRVAGRGTADQELIISLSNELDSTLRELQQSNVALETCQSSRADIQRMQASSRARRTEYIQRQKRRELFRQRGRGLSMTSRNSIKCISS